MRMVVGFCWVLRGLIWSGPIYFLPRTMWFAAITSEIAVSGIHNICLGIRRVEKSIKFPEKRLSESKGFFVVWQCRKPVNVLALLKGNLATMFDVIYDADNKCHDINMMMMMTDEAIFDD